MFVVVSSTRTNPMRIALAAIYLAYGATMALA